MAKCVTPYNKEVDGAYYDFPCGKCYTCLQKRISHWSYRLVQEGKRCSSAYFLTLTYAPEHLPRTKNGFRTIEKSAVQKFLKRLRKQSTTKIKYFAVGEYGTINKRPHYHLIIFNAEPEKIDKAWTLGTTYYGTVANASIGYVLKYMCKKSQIPQHSRDDRQPEFQLFSKSLGDNYLTPQMINWHKSNPAERCIVPLPDGKIASMPKFYKQRIFDDFDKKAQIQYYREQEIYKNNDKNHVEKTEQEVISLLQQKQKNFRRLNSVL